MYKYLTGKIVNSNSLIIQCNNGSLIQLINPFLQVCVGQRSKDQRCHILMFNLQQQQQQHNLYKYLVRGYLRLVPLPHICIVWYICAMS